MNRTQNGTVAFMKSSRGVDWDAEACGALLVNRCILTICGSSRAVFVDSFITGLASGSFAADEWQSPTGSAVLCVAGNANITFSGLQILENQGRALWVLERATVTLTNQSQVVSNDLGPAVVASNFSSLHITGGSVLAGNSAKERGGALYAEGYAEVVVDGGSSFVNNSATRSGGAILVDQWARVNVAGGSSFKNNTAVTRSGGAVVAIGETQVNISHASFLSNQAQLFGGALFTGWGAVLKISDGVTIKNNTAWEASGGGVEVGSDSKGYISGNVTFLQNRAALRTASEREGGVGGGGLHVGDRATVVLSGKTLFGGNAGVRGGALLADGSSNASIRNGVTFQDNWAYTNGGALAARGNATLLITRNVTLISNIAHIGGGGALAADGISQVYLSQRVRVVNNSAADYYGGGVFVKAQARLSALDGVEILDNRASLYGGGMALLMDAHAVFGPNVTMRGNTAELNDGGAVCVEDRASARFKDGCMLVDNNAAAAGGAIAMRHDSTVELTGHVAIANNSAGTGGGIAAAGRAALVVSHGVQFYNNTARSAGPDLIAEADCRLSLSEASIDKGSSTVLWYRKDCVLGEVYTSSYCQPCPAPTYGLDPTFSTCSQCPSHANCTGKDVLIPLPGYWHSHVYSTQIHACPNEKVCLYNGSCAKGYEGHVCGVCAEGYGRQGTFSCKKCMSVAKTGALYASAVVVLILIATILVHTTLQDNQMPLGQNTDAIRPSDFLKILIRHVQYLVIVGSLGITWLPALSVVFTAFGWVFTAASSNAETVSLDCLVAPTAANGMPLAIKVTVINLLTPIAILLAVLLAQAVIACFGTVLWRHRVMRGRQNASLSHQQRPRRIPSKPLAVLSVSYLVVLFFFYPSLVRMALATFACLPLDDVSPSSDDPYPLYAIANASTGYWVSSVQQPCWDGWHRAWALGLGLPCAVLFCLGVPGAIVLLLVVNKQRLAQAGKFKDCLGFLYHNYRPTRYWWEVVNILQLAALAAISVFSQSLGAYYSVLLVHLGFATMLALQYSCKPYAVQLLNSTMLLSFATLFLVSSIALSFFTYDKLAPQLYGQVMGVVGLLLNVGFVLWCCYLIGKHSSGIVKRWLSVVKRWWRANRAAKSSIGVSSQTAT
jgi:predicted outer membrane repeat protein